jgi:hypothetical protein
MNQARGPTNGNPSNAISRLLLSLFEGVLLSECGYPCRQNGRVRTMEAVDNNSFPYKYQYTQLVLCAFAPLYDPVGLSY